MLLCGGRGIKNKKIPTENRKFAIPFCRSKDLKDSYTKPNVQRRM